MALETGTYVNDLVVTNPPGTDTKSQGDDHLRLIKNVLRNTFPGGTKPFYFPTGVAKTANYTVLNTDDKTIFTVDTTAGSFTLTLPTLAAGDAGWSIEVIKNSANRNPVFIAPPSGTINGFTKLRRNLEACITKVIWNGSNYYASRPNGRNIGEIVSFWGPNLPGDLEWANGQALVAANYVELNTTVGNVTLPDLGGTVLAGRDAMAGAGTRIGTLVTDSGTIVGNSLGSRGGSNVHAQTGGEMPSHNHGVNDPTHTHPFTAVLTSAGLAGGGGGAFAGNTPVGSNTGAASTGISIQLSGGGGAMAWLQPTIIVNMGVVCE